MSIDLYVDARSPIPLAVVRASLAACLRELLDIEDVPAIDVVELRNGVRSAAPIDAKIDSERAFIFGVDGYPASVVIGWVQAPDDSQLSGCHPFVSIVAGGNRTPLEFALMAAVAVIVARRESSHIVDGARFFTLAIENDVDAFVEKVRVTGPFTDSVAAAEQFDRHLNHARQPPSGNNDSDQPEPYSRDALTQELASNDQWRISRALIAAALHDSDRLYVESLIEQSLRHPDPFLRGMAALAAGHVARIHRSLTVDRIVPLIEEMLADANREARAIAQHALDDMKRLSVKFETK